MPTLLFQFLVSPTEPSLTPITIIQQLGPSFFVIGWSIVALLMLWVAWRVYLVLKMSDYISAIEWTFLQITLPEDSTETPKAMHIAYDVWGGMHKNPDLVELYFDGYLEAWFSCEMHITQGKVRYIMVVPTAHRRLFEGVIYGQYPRAEIKEVPDYTLRYNANDIRKTFDLYGTEIILAKDDIYPIKTYREYEDALAEEEKYIDPHQSLIEALSHVGPGEEFWIQVLIRPVDAKVIQAWAAHGEEEVAKISGQEVEESGSEGILKQVFNFFKTIPAEVITVLLRGGLPEAEEKKEEKTLRFFNPVDEAKMKGIVQKVSQNAHKAKIRLVYLAPAGQIQKPNISRGIGVFKQFNTWHLNNLYPDPNMKSNGPGFIFRETRRYFRERRIFLLFQWRDFWGRDSGQMFTSEELATLYHFPVNYVRAPAVERAKAGRKGPPDNIPYA